MEAKKNNGIRVLLYIAIVLVAAALVMNVIVLFSQANSEGISIITVLQVNMRRRTHYQPMYVTLFSAILAVIIALFLKIDKKLVIVSAAISLISCVSSVWFHISHMNAFSTASLKKAGLGTMIFYYWKRYADAFNSGSLFILDAIMPFLLLVAMLLLLVYLLYAWKHVNFTPRPKKENTQKTGSSGYSYLDEYRRNNRSK